MAESRVLSERRRKEAALDAVFRRAARERDVAAFLSGLVRELHSAYGASGVAAWILDPPRPDAPLTLLDAVGLAEGCAFGLEPVGESGWSRRVLETREPFVIEELSRGGADPAAFGLPPGAAGAFAAFPLAFQDDFFGLLALVWDRALAEGEAVGLQSFAERASITLGLVRLLTTLRESEERYRALMESAMDAIFLVDASAGDVIACNLQAESLTGKRREELLGRKVWELQGPGGEAAVRALFRRAGEEEAVLLRELPFARADGSILRIDLSATAVEAGGRPIVQAVARDVTELAELHRKLRDHAAELERRVEEKTRELRRSQAYLVQSEKMAAIGAVVAGVAHEINTPVGSLASNVHTARRCADKIREALADPLAAPLVARHPEVERALRILDESVEWSRAACERITGTVRTLKSFVRLDEGELKAVDIHEGLDSTLALVQHELKGRIRVVKDYGRVPAVECRPNQINQVFMNLLVNAAQAIPAEGEVRIRTWFEEPWVKVEVRDTGVGIPPENLPRIFEPGFTTKAEGVGTGLGLSIAQQIAADHCGTLEVASLPGEGAAFTLSLPAKKC